MARIVDAGQKIGGARKDLATRALTEADLASLTDAEGIKVTTKDAVWPKPAWSTLIAAGLSVEQAACAEIVRSRCSSKPTVRNIGLDGRQTRLAYLKVMSILRQVYETPTPDHTPEALRDAAQAALKSAVGPLGILPGVVVPGNKKVFPFTPSRTDRQDIATMIREGFPEKIPAWRVGIEIQSFGEGDHKVFWAVRDGRRIGSTLPSEAKVLEELETQHKLAKASRAPGKRSLAPLPPARAHLDSLERVGPDYRGGRDASPSDFVEVLGFRGVEFGNWMPQNERRDAMNMAWDALHDLAAVLGVEPESLSLGGYLSAAFGSRGSGNALAHFEPGTGAFNLTRTAGGGSLCHEWAHALDNWLGLQDPAPSDGFSVPSVTGWAGAAIAREESLAFLGDDIARSLVALRRSLVKHPLPAEEVEKRVATQTASMERMVKSAEMRLEGHSGTRGRKAYVDELEERTKALEAFRAGGWRSLETVATDFARQASRLDAGKPAGYYTQPCEMFARAFESWVFDRIVEDGRRSDYLVHGVEQDRYETGYRGNPYPTGQERTAIGASLDVLAGRIGPYLDERRFVPTPIPTPLRPS